MHYIKRNIQPKPFIASLLLDQQLHCFHTYLRMYVCICLFQVISAYPYVCTIHHLQVISDDGPYPLLIESPDGGYWLQNGDHEVMCGEDGVWRAPEISTEHYTIQSDKTAFVYGRYFKKQVSVVHA